MALPSRHAGRGIEPALPDTHAYSSAPKVHDSIRRLLALAAFMLANVWLTGPAVAWEMHETAHMSSPVAADEHHHHGEDGAPIQDRDVPSDQQGTGHDHLSSGAASLNATIEAGAALAPYPASPSLPGSTLTAALHDVRRPPPSEPPRLG